MGKVMGIVKKGIKIAGKKSPLILTILAIGSVGGAVYMTAKATSKAVKTIEEKKEELGVEELETKEVIQETWQYFIPAALLTLSAVGCIVGANTINTKRQMALLASASMSSEALKEYKKAMKDTLDEETLEKVEKNVLEQKLSKVKEENIPKLENREDANDEHYERYLIMDEFTGQTFWASKAEIDEGVTYINDLMDGDMEMSATINDFLGLFKGTVLCSSGNQNGWTRSEGRMRARLSGATIDSKGRPCRLLTYDYVTMKANFDSRYTYR